MFKNEHDMVFVNNKFYKFEVTKGQLVRQGMVLKYAKPRPNSQLQGNHDSANPGGIEFKRQNAFDHFNDDYRHYFLSSFLQKSEFKVKDSQNFYFKRVEQNPGGGTKHNVKANFGYKCQLFRHQFDLEVCYEMLVPTLIDHGEAKLKLYQDFVRCKHSHVEGGEVHLACR